ncbi:hypothetical protein TNCV_470991 [Trichonephila clavipes]|nr:hypothetical protein TNCV_470991 [Trichonephila clavipes]
MLTKFQTYRSNSSRTGNFVYNTLATSLGVDNPVLSRSLLIKRKILPNLKTVGLILQFPSMQGVTGLLGLKGGRGHHKDLDLHNNPWS